MWITTLVAVGAMVTTFVLGAIFGRELEQHSMRAILSEYDRFKALGIAAEVAAKNLLDKVKAKVHYIL